MSSHRRLAFAGTLLLLLLLAAPAGAATRCVGKAAGCSATLAKAVDAAADGDTVKLGPGTYPGPILIDADITLQGAGAEKTIIRGGDHVITVGVPFADRTQPTVTIRGVTVTGGFARRAPEEYGYDYPGSAPAGGGIYTPVSKDFGPGADLTVVDSVVRGNRVSPEDSYVVPQEYLPCPGEGCRFGGAFGGGIAANGPLTLIRTTVSGNRTGDVGLPDPQTSDADSAGIDVDVGGSLTLIDSTVANNVAAATGPYAREAAGAGVLIRGDVQATITNSTIVGNRAILQSAYPDGVEQLALGGGLFVDGVDGQATVTGSRLTGNSTRATSSAGFVQAWSGGMHINGVLHMSNSTVSGNSSSSGSPDAASDAYADGGAGEVNGDNGDVSTIEDSRIVANSASAVSGTGAVTAGGGAIWSGALDPGSVAVTDSAVSRNRVRVSSQGETNGYGGGIWHVGGFDLLRSRVTANTVQATGATGVARGGGVFTDAYADDPTLPLTPRLSVTDTAVTLNRLIASSGVDAAGGGIFATTPVTRLRSLIALNSPAPQCVGCGAGVAPLAARRGAGPATTPHRGGAGLAHRLGVHR